MTRRFVLIGLALLLLPALARGVWFYQGAYWRRTPVATPDYDSLTVPQAPVSTAEAPPTRSHEGGALVLIDQTHYNNFQSGELEPLLQQVSARGGQVEFVTSSDSGGLDPRLAAAGALVVVSPSTPYSVDEVRRVEAFVARGGRLLVLTDPTRWTQPYDLYSTSTTAIIDDSSAANTLLAPFDITIADDYLYNLVENEGNFRNILMTSFAASPLTADLTRVAFYASHSIASPSGVALITTDEDTLSSRTDLGGGLAAAVLAANERVLAVGDLSFVSPPYDAVADNARWIANLADFLTGGQPSRSPVDFPYIFGATPAVQTLGNLEMTSDLVKALSGLQSSLGEIGLSLTFSDDPEATANRIVLATYADQADLEPFMRGFSIGLPGTSSDPLTAGKLLLPGWSPLDPSTAGLMLVERTGRQTTLTLIGADPSALVELIETLASRDFSACLAQESLAVCAVEASGKGAFDFNFSTDAVPTPDGKLP
jgi:hypothetical protein